MYTHRDKRCLCTVHHTHTHNIMVEFRGKILSRLDRECNRLNSSIGTELIPYTGDPHNNGNLGAPQKQWKYAK